MTRAGADDKQYALSIETIFVKKLFDEKTIKQPQWMKDNRRLSYLHPWQDSDVQAIWIYDSDTNEREPLFDPNTLRLDNPDRPFPVESFQWSPDEELILLPGAAPAKFKPCGNLYLYDLSSHQFRSLTASDQPQRHPKFSSDGKWIGLVRADDLWLISPETGEERRLTVDAGPSKYNGRCGWVYEEELGLGDAWQWSPDGSKIAYIQQDESAVPEYLIPRYDHPHSEPELTRYPNAGDPNPTARLGILTISTGETRWVDLGNEEHYLTAFQWVPGGSGLLVQRILRLQNRLDLLYIDAESGHVRTVLTETDERWVDNENKLWFVGDTDRFLWPSERDGVRRFYLCDLSGSIWRALTDNFDVDAVVGVDAMAETVFMAAAAPHPYQRHLVWSGRQEVGPICGDLGWHSALSTKDGSRYLHTWSSAAQPPVQTVRDADGLALGTVVENSVPKLDTGSLLKWEFLEIEAPNGEMLGARMLKPRGFDPDGRYPVVMFVYGGPGSQMVADNWGGQRGLWQQMLADRGFLLCAVDGRGTGWRGRDFKKQVYLKLGQMETEDQTAGARYLAGLPIVDRDRIGIWGWSYGGYMVLNCLTQENSPFRAGIAVAPVTDWALYDSIYTERFMQKPADNPEGYRDGSPIHRADKLQGRLLLVHGQADDNVHFQHFARFAEALQKANIPFETMFYPAQRHGLEDVLPHLYGLFTEFLERTL